MILAQFVNRAAIRDKIPYSLPLIFAAALLPDLDFLFYPLFLHHTVTHSLTFWSLVYAPVFAIFRIRALPYFIATLSHFMIGDVITGNPPLFFGLSRQTFGLIQPSIVSTTGDPSYGILFQAIVDAVCVAAFILYSLRNNGIQSIFSRQYNLVHILILGVVMFAIFIGVYRVDLVYGLKTQQLHNSVGYQALAILVISQAVFFLFLAKGVKGKRSKDAQGGIKPLPGREK